MNDCICRCMGEDHVPECHHQDEPTIGQTQRAGNSCNCFRWCRCRVHDPRCHFKHTVYEFAQEQPA